MDLTYDETLFEPPARRLIAHAYDDRLPGDASVTCYAFPEVFVEKIRALGERTRPRDLYDAINLHRRDDLRDSRDRVVAVLKQKCAYKNVPVPTLDGVTGAEKVDELRADWDAMLAHQLPVLPPVDEFLQALPALFAWLGGEDTAVLPSVSALREQIEPTWAAPATISKWPAGAQLEQIRFAGTNRLLVELGYQGTQRLIEPYALRQSKAGHLFVYAVKAATGETRAYRVDRFESVRVTDQPFVPGYANELSTVLSVRTGMRRR